MSTSHIVLFVFIIAVGAYAINNFQGKKQLLETNVALAKTFLEQNKSKEGIISTDSGLQYEILSRGEGTTHPTAQSKVKVHYHGTLLDGKVFDSSVERNSPISFGLNQVIKGWTEGVQLMKEGDKFRFFIPAHLGYGNRGAGDIGPGALLIFEVELLAIES